MLRRDLLKTVPTRVLSALALLAAFAAPQAARAGYFELSLNGSWYRYSNGVIEGEPSTTVVTRAGAGLAYRFLSNTALEINYMNSKTTDVYAFALTPSGGLTERVLVDRRTDMHNLSANLVLYFAPKGASFRPYIRGGGGLMVRQQKVNVTDLSTGGASSLAASSITPVSKSVSADAGLGLNIFVADSIALEGSLSVYATDLDKPEIFLHYAAAGGLRFLF
jgi:hypothetical protein